MKNRRIRSIQARLIRIPLKVPFAISSGSQSFAENIFLRIRLEDGTEGYGEAAPFPAFNQDSPEKVLSSIRECRKILLNRGIDSCLSWFEEIKSHTRRSPSARAALEMALLDCWTQVQKISLCQFFGGAEETLETDLTIPLLPESSVPAFVQKALDQGFRRFKIKVGSRLDADLARVLQVHRLSPRSPLLLDANGGYSEGTAWDFLRRLSRHGIRPELFEQPVPKGNLRGLKKIQSRTDIPIAADESADSLEQVLRLIRGKAVRAVNIKLMKTGIEEARKIHSLCRSAGLELMIGGMVESRLAMTCAAQFAAGLGGFRFVDLDTPYFFSRDPAQGTQAQEGPFYFPKKIIKGVGLRVKGFS